MSKSKNVLMAFDWYDVGLHAGIAKFAQEKNWNLNTHMARTRELPLGWEGDGVIALLATKRTLGFIQQLNLPTIDMGGHFPDFPQVLGDHYKVGVMAAEHFLERNHRNFVFFNVTNSRLEQEVSSGFVHTLQAAGMSCERPQWKESTAELEIRYLEVIRWLQSELKKLPRPLAVFCQNDDTAALIIHAAKELGCAVPDEVAILGAGNSELICKYLPVPLSSIGSNLYGHGYRAAQELHRLLKGESPSRVPVRTQPGRVHVRASTDFLAVSNPHVLKVLKKIWSNYAEPLNIEQLLELVPLSRSALYKLFAEDIGRPMGKELARIRILKAKEILAETSLSATDVGKKCGFNSLISFSRAFSQHVGMSPLAYRKHVLSHRAEAGLTGDALLDY